MTTITSAKVSMPTVKTSPFPIERTFDNKTLIIDIARDEATIEKALRLRYEIFKTEMGCNPSEDDDGIDRDKYDDFFDHLIIVDKELGEIVGTYRLLRAEVAREHIGFYSECEFDLSVIHERKLNLCEIGRACIKQAYRGQAIIALLWAGIASYCEYHGVEYVGGCTTIGKDIEQVQRIYQYAKERDLLLGDEMPIKPNPDNMPNGFDPDKVVDTAGVKRELPPLLRAYFSMGAKLAPIPAYDPDFDVIDFYTFFKFDKEMKRLLRFIMK